MANVPPMIMKLAMPVSLSPSLSPRAMGTMSRCTGFTLHLAYAGFAEHTVGAHRQRKDQQYQPGRFTPAAADIEAGQTFQRTEKNADHHHPEAGIQTGHHGNRKSL